MPGYANPKMKNIQTIINNFIHVFIEEKIEKKTITKISFDIFSGIFKNFPHASTPDNSIKMWKSSLVATRPAPKFFVAILATVTYPGVYLGIPQSVPPNIFLES